ncbi:MAG: hypothetical protein ACREJ9_02860 [Candidatus Rokuibacteriota bacterium]
MCWRHKLQTLKRAQEHEPSGREPRVRFLVVVARHAADLLTQVSEQFLDDPRVQVLLDRRRGDRRKARALHQPDRRQRDRRRAVDYWEDTRHHSVVIVPTWKMSEAKCSTPPSQPPIDEVSAMESTDTVTQAWRNVEAWVRDSQQMLTRVIPGMVQECDELRRRAGAADDHVARLQRELEDLQREVARLGTETDRLVADRSALSDTVQRSVNEIARLAGEVLAVLKER